MVDFTEPQWLKTFQKTVNADPELAVIGTWFTTSLSLTFGTVRYVLRIEKGKIAAIVSKPKLDQPSDFGFRAPVRVWRRFLSPNPPPLYHDFFAMLMRAPDFVLEGNSLLAMQNARALHRMMNLMRRT